MPVEPLLFLVGILGARDGLWNRRGELGVYQTMVKAASKWKAAQEEKQSTLKVVDVLNDHFIRCPVTGEPQ